MSDIIIKVVLDDGAFKKSLDGAEKTAEKAGKEIGTSLSNSVGTGVTKAFGSIKTELLALGSVVAGAFAFKKIISEAVQAENAMNDFKSALRVTGQNVKETSSSFAEFASSLQKTTTASDDAIIQGGALLTSLGKLRGEGLEKATKAALDLSAGMNIDLNNAFEIVAKAAAGNTGALGRYGIKVDETIPKSERFADALNKINTTFGGFAESKVNTFDGAVTQLSNNFNDLLENLGKAIIQSPQVVAVINFLSQKFAEIADSVGKIIGTDFVGNVVKGLISFGQGFVSYVIRPLELVINLLKLFRDAAALNIQEVIVVVTNLGNVLVQAVIFPLQKLVQGAGVLAGTFSKDLQDKFERASGALNSFGEISTRVKDASNEAFQQLEKQANDSLGNLFNFNLTEKASGFLTQLQTAVDTAKAITETSAQQQAATIQQIPEAWKNAAKQITDTVKNGLVNVVSQSMQTLGASLVKGTSAFQGFKGLILNILGDLAIQVGVIFLGYAFAIDALQKAIIGLNPGLAIIAGLALIALGGALKAVAAGEGAPQTSPGSGGFGVGGGVPVGGGAGTVPPVTDNGQANADIQRQQQGTSIAVNIQGNVLDRRQTGLEIADVLNETFGTQGAVIAGVTA